MEPIIRTTKGLVEGIREGSALVFKNIPYALPPVGELRWKRPEEMEAWEGVKPCREFGTITAQTLPGNEQPWEKLFYKEFYSNPDYIRESGEDCLNLNIWTPAASPGDLLPVAFWIHGGGFGGGYSSELEFGGEEYAKRGVILVTVEYRCGALGFLAHPWLSETDPEGISGNYGLFDQIAALKWVRENIAAFGGDPGNITVFGQSAGCMSTQVLVSSPLTKGMIAKAILQSGVQAEKHFLATPTLDEEMGYGERVVKYSGAKSLEELKNLPVRTIMEAKGQFDAVEMMKIQRGEGDSDDAGGLKIVPNVDGVLLKKNVRDALMDGDILQIPYMVGCVVDDLGTSNEDRANGVPGMIMEECESFCKALSERGWPDTYCYLFTRDMPDEDGKSVPAFHSAELWYTFGTMDRCWRPWEERDYELSREMLDAWTNFMKTGDPNGGCCEGWKPYTTKERYVRDFR